MLLLILFSVVAVCTASGPRPGNFSIVDFGGKGDGMTPNTNAINDAIKAVKAHGGGTYEATRLLVFFAFDILVCL